MNKIKKRILIIGGICIIFIFGIIIAKPYILNLMRENRLRNSVELYTKIVKAGELEKKTKDDKNKYPNYNYQVDAYSKERKKYEVDFYAIDGRQFPKGTYVKIYYKKFEGVITYEVINKEEIPKNLHDILSVDNDQENSKMSVNNSKDWFNENIKGIKNLVVTRIEIPWRGFRFSV